MTTERKAFEENLPAHSDTAKHHKKSGDYANHNVQNDWSVWQEAWRESRKVALEDAAIVADSGFKHAKDGYKIADDIRNLK